MMSVIKEMKCDCPDCKCYDSCSCKDCDCKNGVCDCGNGVCNCKCNSED